MAVSSLFRILEKHLHEFSFIHSLKTDTSGKNYFYIDLPKFSCISVFNSSGQEIIINKSHLTIYETHTQNPAAAEFSETHVTLEGLIKTPPKNMSKFKIHLYLDINLNVVAHNAKLLPSGEIIQLEEHIFKKFINHTQIYFSPIILDLQRTQRNLKGKYEHELNERFNKLEAISRTLDLKKSDPKFIQNAELYQAELSATLDFLSNHQYLCDERSNNIKYVNLLSAQSESINKYLDFNRSLAEDNEPEDEDLDLDLAIQSTKKTTRNLSPKLDLRDDENFLDTILKQRGLEKKLTTILHEKIMELDLKWITDIFQNSIKSNLELNLDLNLLENVIQLKADPKQIYLVVRLLIEFFKINPNHTFSITQSEAIITNKCGVSLLWKALETENIQLFEYLLSIGANPDTTNFNGFTILHYCAQHPNLISYAKLALQNQAKINEFVKPPQDLYLVENVNPHRMDTLLQLANLKCKLHHKKQELNRTLTKELRQMDATHYSSPSRKLTPLAFACVELNFEMITLLLQHGADPLIKLELGMDPLSCLLLRKNDLPQEKTDETLAVVKTLIARGSNIQQNYGESKSSLIENACLLKQTNIIRLLFKAGIEPFKEEIRFCYKINTDGLVELVTLNSSGPHDASILATSTSMMVYIGLSKQSDIFMDIIRMQHPEPTITLHKSTSINAIFLTDHHPDNPGLYNLIIFDLDQQTILFMSNYFEPPCVQDLFSEYEKNGISALHNADGSIRITFNAKKLYLIPETPVVAPVTSAETSTFVTKRHSHKKR